MPFGVKPLCFTCKTTTTTLWRKGIEGEVLCNSCWLTQNSKDSGTENDSRGSHKDSGSSVGSHYIGPIRKSARLKPSKYKYQMAPKPFPTKGKGRRIVFKKNPIKAAPSVATVVTSDYIFHEGIYYQIGDIVSVMDHGGDIYYAQLRGFLQDQYCEKSAVITWLLPTTATRGDRMDPSTYILGPEEDLPRPMDCFEFVCRAPSEYYKARYSPYPTVATVPELGYISTSLGSEIKPVPTREEIFGLKPMDGDAKKTPKSPSKKEKKDKTKVKEEKKRDSDKDSKKDSHSKDKGDKKDSKDIIKKYGKESSASGERRSTRERYKTPKVINNTEIVEVV